MNDFTLDYEKTGLLRYLKYLSQQAAHLGRTMATYSFLFTDYDMVKSVLPHIPYRAMIEFDDGVEYTLCIILNSERRD